MDFVIAFLVAAYLVGAKLSRTQLSALIVLYGAFLYMPVSSAMRFAAMVARDPSR